MVTIEYNLTSLSNKLSLSIQENITKVNFKEFMENAH